MGEAALVPVAERSEAKTAIVFVHGFGGDAESTWGRFPELIRDEAASLADWSIYSLGYQSSLAPDIRGVWSGDPGIATLATYLRTRTIQAPLERYDRLALIAHSMGGLVVQKALVDYDDLVQRVGHVLLYGTPSGGLKKASGFLGRLLKRQTEDMGLRSGFIQGLRQDWREKFGDAEQPLAQPANRPFRFWTVAGDRDEFVPATSSHGPFPVEERVVVPGDHLQIVKPGSYHSMSVQATVDGIVGQAAPGGPWNAARVAVEMGDFQRAIEKLWPNVGNLDQSSIVQLALALDAVGRRSDAITALERNGKTGTDALGTLGGRHKRQWMNEGLRDAAENARSLYQEGYDTSSAKGDHAQALYHGINLAFMKFAFEQDGAGAKELAGKVLRHCADAPKRDVWCIATEAEANLYLDDAGTALGLYREAVGSDPEPWMMDSMYLQATRIAEVIDSDDVRDELRRIFRGA